ncbi:MAG: hypothetical protein M1834_004707 [Cirrosporium novae-zelandiae]|nr:MAG: hypothetical protein M1834_004707 [Cirrosporium novae-zelandiae]
MADPFEVRLRFTTQLQRLNASVNSSQKVAMYAMKNKDMDEDLHSCILEQLENNNMNVRANIMYFIEHFCGVAEKEGHFEYIQMIQRDILRIVDAVAPADGTGATNVKVVQHVLGKMQQKSFLAPEIMNDIEARLAERDTAANPPISPEHGVARHGTQTYAFLNRQPFNRNLRVDKRQIEQRIEEDRERHKRLKEEMWKVSNDTDKEFDEMWDNLSDIGEDDYLNAKEEAEERQQAAKEHIVVFSAYVK